MLVATTYPEPLVLYLGMAGLFVQILVVVACLLSFTLSFFNKTILVSFRISLFAVCAALAGAILIGLSVLFQTKGESSGGSAYYVSWTSLPATAAVLVFTWSRRQKNRLHEHTHKSLKLLVSDDGLALLDGEREVYRLKWAEVSKVETYKRDLGTVDLICLDFTLATRDIVYMADDEMVGFDELTKQLAQYFPSVPADWWSEVAFPAFATKHKVLFDQIKS